MARPSAIVTDAELSVLNHLWEHGPSVVREIASALYSQNTPAYHATVNRKQPARSATFGSCSTLQRRVEVIVSQNPLPLTSNWASVFLFALLVLPFGIAKAEEEAKEDWSATRREFVERVEELTGEIEELRNEGENSWVKHLIGRRAYLKSILPKLDEIVKPEEALAKAQGGQDFDQIEQLEHKLESLMDKFWRAERIGEMEGNSGRAKGLEE